jgi:hypothetical protein
MAGMTWRYVVGWLVWHAARALRPFGWVRGKTWDGPGRVVSLHLIRLGGDRPVIAYLWMRDVEGVEKLWL